MATFHAEIAGRNETLRVIQAAHGHIAIQPFEKLKAERRTAAPTERSLRNRGGLVPIRARKPFTFHLGHIFERDRHSTRGPLAHATVAEIGVEILDFHLVTNMAALAAAGKRLGHALGLTAPSRNASALPIVSIAIIYVPMSEELGFLIGDTARLMRRAFDERVRNKGITRPQWRVLGLLSRFGGSTQVALAEMMDVEPITLGRMIDRLQEACLVERRADPADRRAWRVHLTAAGEARLTDLKPLANELFADAVAGLSDKEQSELEAMLDIIRLNLTRRAPEVANG